MLQCVVLCFSLIVASAFANIASFIKPCKPTDFTCIKKSSEIALPYFSPGIPELGIPSTDPLATHNVESNTDGLHLTFKNITVRGLGKCKFNKVERDPVQSTGLIDVECPIECTGDYTMNGNLFLLDVEGKGPFTIKGDKINVIVTIKLKTNTKSGKKYYKITSFDYTYEPISKFHFQFENLYNGDKKRAEPFEKILNQNGKELLLGVGKPVIKEVVTRVIDNVGKLFHKVPLDEIEIA